MANQLTNEQKQEIRALRVAGNKPKQIKQAFMGKHNIDLQGWEISTICKGIGKKEAASRKKKSSPGGGVHKNKEPDSDNGTDKIKSLVDQLQAELEAYSKFVIGNIRIELVKAIGEARKKRIDAGEAVEPFEEGAVKE